MRVSTFLQTFGPCSKACFQLSMNTNMSSAPIASTMKTDMIFNGAMKRIWKMTPH